MTYALLVGKRFIRSLSSLKKSHQTNNNSVDTHSQSRLKIDEERTLEGESIKKTKTSLKSFFGGNKRQPKDIFENSNEVFIRIYNIYIYLLNLSNSWIIPIKDHLYKH